MSLFTSIKLIVVSLYLWVTFDLVYGLSHNARSIFYGTVGAMFALFYPKSLVKRLIDHLS